LWDFKNIRRGFLCDCLLKNALLSGCEIVFFEKLIFGHSSGASMLWINTAFESVCIDLVKNC
jgi:hypothetical protein